jgi:uncharacterized protein (DUF1330 family)
MPVDPTSQQLQHFVADAADPEPVFMLNLLRFHATTETGETGVETYGRYAAAAAGHLARVGGEIVWAGGCSAALIGPEEGEWDVVAVVRYPSRTAFIDMVADPDYQRAAADRTAALADSRLIPCAQVPASAV